MTAVTSRAAQEDTAGRLTCHTSRVLTSRVRALHPPAVAREALEDYGNCHSFVLPSLILPVVHSGDLGTVC